LSREVGAGDAHVDHIDPHSIDPHSINPWERARECVRARQVSHADADRWALLTELIEMWTNLANHRPFLTPEENAQEAARIDALHAQFVAPLPARTTH